MNNTGLNLNKEAQDIKPEDYTFGSGEELTGIAEGIPFEPYLPKGEVQRTPKGDMMDCATRSPINMGETKFNYAIKSKKLAPFNIKWLIDHDYIKNGCMELSDAYTAIKSGTTRNGNSLIAPLEAMRKWGCVPKSLMPLENWMNWWDYHNKARITPAIEALGLEFARRFPMKYERVAFGDFPNVIKWDMIGVAGFAWTSPQNGIYPRTANRINHAFVYFEKPRYQIFDNYIDSFDGDFIKNLASDYNLLRYGYRLIINENMTEVKKKMINLKRATGTKKVFAIIGLKKYWVCKWENLEDFIEMFGYRNLKEAQNAVQPVEPKHLDQYAYGGNLGNPSIWEYFIGRNK